VVAGRVRLSLDRKDSRAPLVLDAQGLSIDGVSGEDGSARSFQLGAEHDGLGGPLTIELGEQDRAVAIDYHTAPGAEALQWLAPEQTAGGRRPFLFSQGESVLTRTWIPMQDTPAVRITYSARVRCPEPLTVVMSALRDGRDATGAFLFHLDRPIPCYLIALGCGELVSRELSPRAAVWAEPATIDAAAWEFADTEAMIHCAEELYGPYLWGRYDLLILPPAFPFGGMENPLLTFVTPTVIAGDRSLVSLVAHELAHSWSGNLVTNATWSDFWLNEGFTVYFEKRIMERLYGAERARMEILLDIKSLEESIAKFEPWKTVLHPDLARRHPEDAFSNVPYEKGALFLRRLEEIFGREGFDAFLRSWFDEHRFESVTTADFVAFLEERLLAKDPARARQIDLHAWIDEPGLPADAPRPHSDGLALVDREFERFAKGTSAAELDTRGWVPQQWLRLLDRVRPEASSTRLSDLDQAWNLTQSGNAEILSSWLVLAVRAEYHAADARLEEFLLGVGRRKLLQPIYEELAKSAAGKARALEIYERARPRYHALTRGTIDKILGV
jgi:aminopeptidase N